MALTRRCDLGTSTPHIESRAFAVRSRAAIRGFTIVELAVTLAVALILATVAVPQFAQIIQNERLSSQVNEFVSDLNFARSEAIKRAVNVAVCPGNYPTGCTGTWSDGRIVFVDADGNNAWTADETIIRARTGLASGYALTASAGTPVIVFSGSGTLALAVDGTPVGVDSYAFCREGVSTSGKEVSVQTLGRVSALKTPPGSC